MRLILTVGYLKLGVVGSATLVAGVFLIALIGVESSQSVMLAYISLMGNGMRFSTPSFLVAVQTTIERRHLSSTIQCSRSISGILGTSAMGAALSACLASNLNAAWFNPNLISPISRSCPRNGVCH